MNVDEEAWINRTTATVVAFIEVAIKMNFLNGVILASAIAGISVSAASAASFKIEQAEGTILVQDEKGFGPAHVGRVLITDQQILVKAKSALLLMGTESSCFVHITSPGLYALSADMPCVVGQVSRLDAKLAITPTNGNSQALITEGYGSQQPLFIGGAFAATVGGVGMWQMVNNKTVSHP